MSPTRLEWLLMLSLRQMKEAQREGLKARAEGTHADECPYVKDTARATAWLKGWNESDTRQVAQSFDRRDARGR